MADLGGSNTPKELKDKWQTPIEIFTALDIEFGFYLDAAADYENALCAHYLTERNNALNSEWISYGAIYCNPPYSDISPWVIKAAEQCRKQLQPVVMLVPADTSVGWFKLAMNSVDEIRIITGGRISFINAGNGKEKKGNTKGSLLLIWRPFIKPRCMFTTIDKSELARIGSNILKEIKHHETY
ncbi:phage N-6-adenine-methyltransferase [Photorhabdus temperata]|uniref:Phage N-6-adenine-methyltransferase n=1 Tax=Photorhabdus khanii NC19 TaxID=1004151 RepID=W3V7V6_9GAMM|nr:phage N-6-adenine-methyltransferase [Photorhabdus khanii]ETS31114.1 phage N-6-adenine-methyltransferase [Photorhabdus khanii NC19]OHV54919.1 phage N-6-adenine-methyltransferase [Photorhabdus temperata]